MKQINYILHVKEVGQPISESWSEKITEVVADRVNIKEHAKEIVEHFNKYLKPGEKKRVFIMAEEFDNNEKASLKHDWGKVSLMTEKGGFDRMECKRCGVTGKRYGLGERGIQLDKEFKKQINCPG